MKPPGRIPTVVAALAVLTPALAVGQDRLAGRWTLDLRVQWHLVYDSMPRRLIVDSTTFALQAQFELRSLKTADPALRQAAVENMQRDAPTHFAADTIQFPALRFTGCLGVPPAPPLLAQLGPNHGVWVAIGPYCDHGSLVLSGRFQGDSIAGKWEMPGYTPRARGTFVMRRP